MATRDGQHIDLIWVLVDLTHPSVNDLLAEAKVAQKEHLPTALLSVNRFTGTRALVKLGYTEQAFRARLPLQVQKAIIRVYTEEDHHEARALIDGMNEIFPELTLKAILDFDGNTDDGRLVRAVAVPWFEIVKVIREDPTGVYQIDWRKWEEIIAGAYVKAGFDEVILTPRSGDGGKDIIAVKKGIGSIRIFDQVKVYRPSRLVSADEVRSMLGVVGHTPNVSKGIITTTSNFAPKLMDDPAIAANIPYRLELKPRDDLLQWLASLV